MPVRRMLTLQDGMFPNINAWVTINETGAEKIHLIISDQEQVQKLKEALNEALLKDPNPSPWMVDLVEMLSSSVTIEKPSPRGQ